MHITESAAIQLRYGEKGIQSSSYLQYGENHAAFCGLCSHRRCWLERPTCAELLRLALSIPIPSIAETLGHPVRPAVLRGSDLDCDSRRS